MSSIKKTTAKATKSPAPATKQKSATAKPAVKKASAKTAAAKNEAATAAIVAAVARVAAPILAEPPAAVAPKEVTAKPVTTIIMAKIDIGFGNALFLRGEGPGLSWDRGLEMTNVGSDLWQAELGEAARPFAFKFLVNDLTWSAGEDCTAASGSRLIFIPSF